MFSLGFSVQRCDPRDSGDNSDSKSLALPPSHGFLKAIFRFIKLCLAWALRYKENFQGTLRFRARAETSSGERRLLNFHFTQVLCPESCRHSCLKGFAGEISKGDQTRSWSVQPDSFIE